MVAALLVSQAGLTAAKTLYREFRPLTGLPWKNGPANVDEVLSLLYREPDQFIRRPVLERYLATLPAEEFPRVVDRCIELEKDDTPDELLTLLMRAWAAKDPVAAWARCEQWYELIITQSPLDVDSWGTSIFVMNSEATEGSTFWPKSHEFADGFLEGLKSSALPQSEKTALKLREKQKTDAWESKFLVADLKAPVRGQLPTPSPEAKPPTPEEIAEQEKHEAARQEAERRRKAEIAFLFDVLDCPREEIQPRLAAQPESLRPAVLARAMVRWMNGDAKHAPTIIDAVRKLNGGSGFDRENVARREIPTTFLVEWALLDAPGYLAWWAENKEEADTGAKAVAAAFSTEDARFDILGGISDQEGASDGTQETAFAWAAFDPETALPWIWNRGGLRTYGMAAESIWEPDAATNFLHSAVQTMDGYVVPVPDDPLYMIMVGWSAMDAASVARCGVHWNLKVRRFSKERMIRLWTGQEEPEDGSVDDRHFGSLRIWAARKPQEVRAWIEGESFDPEIRKALLWLVDHAKPALPLAVKSADQIAP